MNEELTQDERKQWARALYTYQDVTIADIALEVSAAEGEVRTWMREDKWQEVKRSRLTSKAAQLDYLYALLENLRGKGLAEANPKEADYMLKYCAAIANLEEATSISEIIEVSELFIRWLRRRDLSLTKKLITHFDTFIKERLES